MPFFILFVVGAMVVGAGALLSPALPTREPRIGLAATFALALIVGGAVFWSYGFGWDALVIDYLLFALMSFAVLGGTLSQAQMRAEAQGEELSDEEMGWPGLRDLLFLTGAAIICMIPVMLMHIPDSPTSALQLDLTQQVLSENPDVLAEIGFEPPGFVMFSAYLGKQLLQEIPIIHLALGAVLSFLAIFLAYDIGAEIQSKRLGRAMAVVMIGTAGIFLMQWNGYYTELMGVLFGFAFTLFTLRYYRQHLLIDLVGAGLMLGAVLFVNPPLFMMLLIAYYVVAATQWLWSTKSKTIAPWNAVARFGLWAGMVAVMLAATAPYTVRAANYWLNREAVLDLNFWLIESGALILPVVLVGGYVILRLYDNLRPGTEK